MGEMWTDNGLVFPNGYGTIMIPHNIAKRSFKRYLVKAGLSRDIRFHDLRHTAATLLLASGVNARVVTLPKSAEGVAIRVTWFRCRLLPEIVLGFTNQKSVAVGTGRKAFTIFRTAIWAIEHGRKCTATQALAAPWPHASFSTRKAYPL